MSSPPRAGSRLALVVSAALVALTACGVPLQPSAQPLPPDVLPSPLRVPVPVATTTDAPGSTAAPDETSLKLWFVREEGLVAVPTDLPPGTAPDLVVQSLSIGPTPPQTADGLRTVARDPLTGLALVNVVPTPVAPTSSLQPASGPPTPPPVTTPPTVTVQVSSAFTALPPVEQVLLLGQVVLSLTGAGEEAVAFTDESGAPLAVPLPDGRLLVRPANAADFAGLILR